MDEFSWFVGLVEGEGCFYASKHGQMMLTLKMTDEDIIQRAAEFLGGIKYKKVGGNHLSKKQLYRVRKSGGITKGWLYDFLKKAYPFFSKRRQEQIDAAFAKGKECLKHKGLKWV